MLSTTWPLTVRGGEGDARSKEHEVLGSPCVRSLRSDARPVRHQTSYIDHIIGPFDTRDRPIDINGFERVARTTARE